MTSIKHSPRRGLAYYTVANAAYYPGLVALINSLTLVGQPAPIFVTDCGLTDRQREGLEQHVTLVSAEKSLHPTLQKATGPLTNPAEVMAIIDADIIVTRSMSELVKGPQPVTLSRSKLLRAVPVSSRHGMRSAWGFRRSSGT